MRRAQRREKLSGEAVRRLSRGEPGSGQTHLLRWIIDQLMIGGRRVDMRTPGDLSRYFRDDVIARAVVQ